MLHQPLGTKPSFKKLILYVMEYGIICKSGRKPDNVMSIIILIELSIDVY